MKKWIYTFPLMMLLGGCAMFEKVGPSELIIHDTHEEKVHIINEKLQKSEELYDTIIIAGEDKILVSYKVHHMNRFHMKKIEKKIKKWTEEEFPDQEVDVSSDYKIFLESYNLFQSWEDGSLSIEEAQKKLDKIITLKNDLT
ncbi:hypothetical protein [Jeotgalibacillus campisalis]|uniref:Sporulation protein n=1 Tax=Jeotgalibacillus campisalis TaxID=220754 RepID=A0A0C2VET7_9BACL|nr:hypothetical protein [Jeotgalibacillus campisalis]KIL47432.1 hypothetical protein KR50_15990 [Jeotgalibacillus campisalis]